MRFGKKKTPVLPREGGIAFGVFAPQFLPEVTDESVRGKALSARRSKQPGGWGTKVIETQSGLRWACCGNPFDEDHSPYCRTEGTAGDPWQWGNPYLTEDGEL